MQIKKKKKTGNNKEHKCTASPASKVAVEPPCFFFLLRSSLLGFKVNLLICLFVSCTQCCLPLLIPLNAGLVFKPGADKTCYLLCTEKAKCVFLIAEKRNLSSKEPGDCFPHALCFHYT